MEKIKLPDYFHQTDWETSVKIEELNNMIQEYDDEQTRMEMRSIDDKIYPDAMLTYYCKTTLLALNMMETFTYITGIETPDNMVILKTLPQFKEIEKLYSFAVSDYCVINEQLPGLFEIHRLKGE